MQTKVSKIVIKIIIKMKKRVSKMVIKTIIKMEKKEERMIVIVRLKENYKARVKKTFLNISFYKLNLW